MRFIYVKKKEDYVRLETTRDTLDWDLDETLDINRWDIKKVLQHFHKSNATIFEWANSSIVYKTTDDWTYNEYLNADSVKYKKYFYALRPILAAKWIEKKKCPPPVLFQDLVDEVLEDEMKNPVASLVEQKVKMAESDKAPKIDVISNYLVENIAYYKGLMGEGQSDDRKPEWDELDKAFWELINGS